MTIQIHLLRSLLVILIICSEVESFHLLKTKYGSIYLTSTADKSSKHSPALHASSPLYYHDTREDLQHNLGGHNDPSIKKGSKLEHSSSTISIPLINSICVNQVMLLIFVTSIAIFASLGEISSLHWTEMQDFHSLFDWQLSWIRFIEGILATIPMIAVGRSIQTSGSRNASHVNFATTNMVISLFGRRKSAMEPTATSSFQVILLSLVIAALSGISEEVTFRGYIPTSIFAMTHSLLLAIIGQAAIFATGHLSRDARAGENELNGSVQFFNGLWYGAVYLLTGGDVLPCIISHILYDMDLLCETWTLINNQMDYTQESSIKSLSKEEKSSMEQLKVDTGVTLNAETVNFARRFFYAFDNDHAGCLSLSDSQRAVSYAFINDTISPDMELVRDMFEQVKEQRRASEDVGCITAKEFKDRLNFSEFLHVLFLLRSNSREASC